MKIDELYFGYTPYSKYVLLEENNNDTSSNKTELKESKKDESTIKKNKKVNLSAYFRLTQKSSPNQDGPKGFEEELEDLLNTSSEADSIASELNAEKEHGERATLQAIINNQEIKRKSAELNLALEANKKMTEVIKLQETEINDLTLQNNQLKNNQKEPNNASTETQTNTQNSLEQPSKTPNDDDNVSAIQGIGGN